MNAWDWLRMRVWPKKKPVAPTPTPEERARAAWMEWLSTSEVSRLDPSTVTAEALVLALIADGRMETEAEAEAREASV